jgi:DNA-binding transcriptional MerR regulator
MTIKIDKRRSIGEVSKDLDVPTHVIRFWESQFSQIRPKIGRGSRRYYYDKDIKILGNIKAFLYEDGFTIKGLKKLISKNRSFLLTRGEEDVDESIIKVIDPQIDLFTGEAKLEDYEITQAKEIANEIKEDLINFRRSVREG